jgi:rhomboid family protein
MIPISDENPTLRTPIMTWLLLGAMFTVWAVAEGGGMNDNALVATICRWGLVPGEITHRVRVGEWVPMGGGLACLLDWSPSNYLTPITSIFVHGGWGHILGNAAFLWVFGNNIEDSMGSWRFLAFFLCCGVAAAGTHILIRPESPFPTVGASGAISGVLGAYLLLYPRVRVNMLFIFVIIFRVIPIPAWIVLIWWFVVQVIAALPQLSAVGPELSSGVAVWAHIGGFVAGLILVKVFEDERLVAARSEIRRQRRLASDFAR